MPPAEANAKSICAGSTRATAHRFHLIRRELFEPTKSRNATSLDSPWKIAIHFCNSPEPGMARLDVLSRFLCKIQWPCSGISPAKKINTHKTRQLSRIMTQEDLKSVEEAEQDQQAIREGTERGFDIRVDSWDDSMIAPIYVHEHWIQRQQVYTGDA